MIFEIGNNVGSTICNQIRIERLKGVELNMPFNFMRQIWPKKSFNQTFFCLNLKSRFTPELNPKICLFHSVPDAASYPKDDPIPRDAHTYQGDCPSLSKRLSQAKEWHCDLSRLRDWVFCRGGECNDHVHFGCSTCTIERSTWVSRSFLLPVSSLRQPDPAALGNLPHHHSVTADLELRRDQASYASGHSSYRPFLSLSLVCLSFLSLACSSYWGPIKRALRLSSDSRTISLPR